MVDVLVFAPHPDDAELLCGAPKYDPASARGIASHDRPPYRPRHLLHYNNRYLIRADVILDISSVFEEKLELVRCYKTQFGSGDDDGKKKGNHGPQTKLS